MAHFAEINEGNEVTRVVVVANIVLHDGDMVEREQNGIDFLKATLGGNTWVQTSYNHSFRKNFASVGYTYDSSRNAFIAPQTFPSWVLDNETCTWEPPTPYPDDGLFYNWNETTLTWDEVN